MNRPNLEDYYEDYSNNFIARAHWETAINEYCDALEQKYADACIEYRDAVKKGVSFSIELEKYRKALRKSVEKQVTGELLSMQCQISPEYFDELVEKRFNKLIKEVDKDIKC